MPTTIRTIGLIAAAGLGVCGALTTPSTSLAAQPATTERPLQPEKNPPGDIPDNQVFVQYTSPRGFSFKVPEGWARKGLSDGAPFVHKYVVINATQSTAPPPPHLPPSK